MQLIVRNYSGSGLKLQLLHHILSSAVICYICMVILSESTTMSKEEFCLDINLKCVSSSTSMSGPIYNPVLFRPLCATDNQSCRKFANQCELTKANCYGPIIWKTTKNELCNSINIGETGQCNCPDVQNCNTGKNFCARHLLTCSNFKDECEFKMAKCRGEIWKKTNPLFCCDFQENESKDCALAAIKPTCATVDDIFCRKFTNFCEMKKHNVENHTEWHERSYRHCECLGIDVVGFCSCGQTS